MSKRFIALWLLCFGVGVACGQVAVHYEMPDAGVDATDRATPTEVAPVFDVKPEHFPVVPNTPDVGGTD